MNGYQAICTDQVVSVVGHQSDDTNHVCVFTRLPLLSGTGRWMIPRRLNSY